MRARFPYFARLPFRFANTATVVQTFLENRASVRFLRCEGGFRPLGRIRDSYGTIPAPKDGSSPSNHIRPDPEGQPGPGRSVPPGARLPRPNPPSAFGALCAQCTPHQISIHGVPNIHQERAPAARLTRKVDHSCRQRRMPGRAGSTSERSWDSWMKHYNEAVITP